MYTCIHVLFKMYSTEALFFPVIFWNKENILQEHHPQVSMLICVQRMMTTIMMTWMLQYLSSLKNRQAKNDRHLAARCWNIQSFLYKKGKKDRSYFIPQELCCSNFHWPSVPHSTLVKPLASYPSWHSKVTVEVRPVVDTEYCPLVGSGKSGHWTGEQKQCGKSGKVNCFRIQITLIYYYYLKI